MKISAIASALALAVPAAGCGQALVPGTTYDGPLITLAGTIGPAGELASTPDRSETGPARHPLVTLLWTDPLQRQPDVPAPAATIGSTIDRAQDDFTLDIFRPPPASALVDVTAPSGDLSTLAFAEIVLIDDADGDGTFRVSGPRAEIEGPDIYLGGSVSVLAYVARPYPSPQVESPVVPAGLVGFQALTYECMGQTAIGIDEAAPGATGLIVQRSVSLPELRNCRRTHSP